MYPVIHVGIVEKVHETSSDTGIIYALESHALLCYMNSGCVLENRHTNITLCNLVTTYIRPYTLHKQIIQV